MEMPLMMILMLPVLQMKSHMMSHDVKGSLSVPLVSLYFLIHIYIISKGF